MNHQINIDEAIAEDPQNQYSMTQEYKLNLVNHQECLSVGGSERRAIQKLNNFPRH